MASVSAERGPRSEFNGRLYTVELDVYVTADATPEDIGERIAFELGGGSISINHPVDESDIHDVIVTRVRPQDIWSYTDWDAADESGRRSGVRRTERRRRPLTDGEQA